MVVVVETKKTCVEAAATILCFVLAGSTGVLSGVLRGAVFKLIFLGNFLN